jgi:hypothetical protein
MADDCGRVNSVVPHFLGRGAREESYQGRHGKKHPPHRPDHADKDVENSIEDDAGEAGVRTHIDLRV